MFSRQRQALGTAAPDKRRTQRCRDRPAGLGTALRRGPGRLLHPAGPDRRVRDRRIEPRLYVAEHQRLPTRSPENLDAGLRHEGNASGVGLVLGKEIDAAEALLRRAIDTIRTTRGRTVSSRGACGARDRMADPREALTTLAPWRIRQSGATRRPDPSRQAMSTWFRAASTGGQELSERSSTQAAFDMFLGSVYGPSVCPRRPPSRAIAARLSPRDFAEAGNSGSQAGCHFVAGRFADAVERERKAVDLRPHRCRGVHHLGVRGGGTGRSRREC